MDFRKERKTQCSLMVKQWRVSPVLNFTEDLSWAAHTSTIIGKAQQHLFFLLKLRRAGLPQNLLVNFYRCAVESIITYCITAWFTSCTKKDQRDLQRLIKMAQYIIGIQLPAIGDIYQARCQGRALNIIRDPTHPGHHHFQLLPSGRRYRTVQSHPTRQKNSFFPQAVKLMIMA